MTTYNCKTCDAALIVCELISGDRSTLVQCRQCFMKQRDEQDAELAKVQAQLLELRDALVETKSYALAFGVAYPESGAKAAVDIAAGALGEPVSKALRKIVAAARTEALTRYAHWHDGVQYVGTTGKTLAEALAEYEAE